MKAELHLDLEDELRLIVREEVALIVQQEHTISPWFNVRSAKDYLDMTEDALRGLVKRNQIPHHRSAETGALRFRREELDDWARGEAA